MMGFNMRDMTEELGEEYIKKVVSCLVCLYNHDVEFVALMKSKNM